MGGVGKPPYISVVGGSSATPEEAVLAEQLGEALLSLGAILICGGGGGVMYHVAKGAQKGKEHGGGLVLGILSGTDRQEANPYIDVVIPTGMGEMRNALIAQTGDVMIAIGGGAGTLSEMALAWYWQKPIGVLGTSGWAGRLAGTPIDKRRTDSILSFTDPQKAASWAVQMGKQKGKETPALLE